MVVIWYGLTDMGCSMDPQHAGTESRLEQVAASKEQALKHNGELLLKVQHLEAELEKSHTEITTKGEALKRLETQVQRSSVVHERLAEVQAENARQTEQLHVMDEQRSRLKSLKERVDGKP